MRLGKDFGCGRSTAGSRSKVQYQSGKGQIGIEGAEATVLSKTWRYWKSKRGRERGEGVSMTGLEAGYEQRDQEQDWACLRLKVPGTVVAVAAVAAVATVVVCEGLTKVAGS